MITLERLRRRWQRFASVAFGARWHPMGDGGPLVSFTFDDFPRSAAQVAGALLAEAGVAGTYYASFGLAGRHTPTGEIFHHEDLAGLLEHGHEIGCHTYDHLHSYDTPVAEFEASVLRNRAAAAGCRPAIGLRTLAYPLSGPRPATKVRCGRHFLGCRAGGQAFNVGRVDLNAMKSYFLEHSGGDLDAVREMIDANARAGGWLIFSTHDVCRNPTCFGCEPEFFGAVLRHALASGAAVLPVAAALGRLGAKPAGGC